MSTRPYAAPSCRPSVFCGSELEGWLPFPKFCGDYAAIHPQTECHLSTGLPSLPQLLIDHLSKSPFRGNERSDLRMQASCCNLLQKCQVMLQLCELLFPLQELRNCFLHRCILVREPLALLQAPHFRGLLFHSLLCKRIAKPLIHLELYNSSTLSSTN